MEINKYGDTMILNSKDKYEGISEKVYIYIKWMNQYKFDYLMKTDDVIFILIFIQSICNLYRIYG